MSSGILGFSEVDIDTCKKVLENYKEWDIRQSSLYQQGLERIDNLPEEGWWIFKSKPHVEIFGIPHQEFPECFDDDYDSRWFWWQHRARFNALFNLIEATNTRSILVSDDLTKFINYFKEAKQ